MLKSEFIAAANQVAALHGRTFEYDMPTALWQALQACYGSRKLDKICVGTNRHERFAQWVYDNQEQVNRLAVFIARKHSERRDMLRKRIAELELELSLAP